MTRAYASFPRTAALVDQFSSPRRRGGRGGAGTEGAGRTATLHACSRRTAASSGATPPSTGTAIPSSKQIILNPYHVPLIQNAGSLEPGR